MKEWNFDMWIGAMRGAADEQDGDALLQTVARFFEWKAEGDPSRAEDLTMIAGELVKLAPRCKKNARGAGRKKFDDTTTEKYNLICEMLESGVTMKEIMVKADVSRATYFRYKRLYDATKPMPDDSEIKY